MAPRNETLNMLMKSSNKQDEASDGSLNKEAVVSLAVTLSLLFCLVVIVVAVVMYLKGEKNKFIPPRYPANSRRKTGSGGGSGKMDRLSQSLPTSPPSSPVRPSVTRRSGTTSNNLNNAGIKNSSNNAASSERTSRSCSRNGASSASAARDNRRRHSTGACSCALSAAELPTLIRRFRSVDSAN